MAKWDNLIILNRIFLHPKHSHHIRKVQRRVCDSHSCRSQWANMLHWDISLLFKGAPFSSPWNELSSKQKWTRLLGLEMVKPECCTFLGDPLGALLTWAGALSQPRVKFLGQKQLKWLLVQLERQGDGCPVRCQDHSLLQDHSVTRQHKPQSQNAFTISHFLKSHLQIFNQLWRVGIIK